MKKQIITIAAAIFATATYAASDQELTSILNSQGEDPQVTFSSINSSSNPVVGDEVLTHILNSQGESPHVVFTPDMRDTSKLPSDQYAIGYGKDSDFLAEFGILK